MMSEAERKPSPSSRKTVFISYRRGDTAGYAELAFSILDEHLPGQVFFDKEGMDIGLEYGAVIRREAQRCEILLVLIGKDWRPEQLDGPNDWIRTIISSAFQGGAAVIPVILPDGRLPSRDSLPEDVARLVDHNALEVTSGTGREELERLAQKIIQRQPVAKKLGYALQRNKPWVVSGVALVLLFCAVALVALRADSINLGPKRGPNSLTVGALLLADYTSISQAIAHAKPGTQIFIRPGQYREALTIDKPLELIGDGKPEDIIIESTDQHVILFRATQGRISKLTIRQRGESAYGVNITQGNLELEDCDISSEDSPAVVIHGEAEPRLRNNRIHGSGGRGVLIYKNGRGILENNEIFANTGTGVEIKEGSNPTLLRNRIHDNDVGVLIAEGSAGVLENNDIFSNALFGVSVHDESTPRLSRNRIYGNKSKSTASDKTEAGVGVWLNKSKGVLEENEISFSGGFGILITDESMSVLRHNSVYSNMLAGIAIMNASKPELEDNQVFSNIQAGVAVLQESEPILRRNQIYKNEIGVSIAKSSKGEFEDNQIFSNSNHGVGIVDGSAPTLRRNRINENEDGVKITSSQGVLEGNEIASSKRVGIDIFGGAPVLRQNNIHDAAKDGVHFHEGSKGTLENNDIVANERGIVVQEASSPTITANRVMRNRAVGIQVDKGSSGIIENNDLRDNKRGAWNVSPESNPNLKRSHNEE